MVIRIECDILAYWSGSHWSLNFVVTTGEVAKGWVSTSHCTDSFKSQNFNSAR